MGAASTGDTSMNYTVSTRDTDGGDKRQYSTLGEAIARFVEMSGQSLESAINESFEFSAIIPTIHTVKHVQAISHFGTVVEFTRNCEAEAEPVAAVPALSDDYDTLADGGILTFGRIPGRLVGTFRRPITHWCDLTEAGWALAHQLRRARAAKVEPTRAAINAVRAARAADTEESQPQERTA